MEEFFKFFYLDLEVRCASTLKNKIIMKPTLKNHLWLLEFDITTTIVVIISSKLLFPSVFWQVFAVKILTVIPAMYLHVQYYIKNYRTEVSFKDDSLLYIKKGAVSKLRRTDVSHIVVYKPASLENRGIPISSIEYYHFCRLVTVENKTFDITCLITRDFEQFKDFFIYSEVVTERGFASTNREFYKYD